MIPSWKRSIGLCDGAAVGSIPQQFVDRRLRARRFVDTLDDHGAIEVRARFTFPGRLARQRARNDDGKGRHLAAKYLAGLAVDNPRRGTDEHAHGKDRALRSEEHTSELQS